jgi:hypothetical protein
MFVAIVRSRVRLLHIRRSVRVTQVTKMFLEWAYLCNWHKTPSNTHLTQRQEEVMLLGRYCESFKTPGSRHQAATSIRTHGHFLAN